ncbi:MAG TPA: hypothetical protein ENI86_13595 [Acidimicrobiales bacterium]|nr:hypothetical protein [Acidimicrobiales bacterium]
MKGKWQKHADEFPDLTDADDFADHVDGIVMNPSQQKKLKDGREAFLGDDGTVVITNPKDPDGGTAFRPDRGTDYFDDLE